MQANLGTISWANVKSAIVSAIFMALLAMASYAIGVGDIFQVSAHTLANVGILSALTVLVSLSKSFFTTSQGKFLGVVKVK